MSACDFVTLNDGLVVPLPALQTLWHLEDRGVTLRLDGDSIVANPGSRLTNEDRVAIRRWRLHVVAILTMSERVQ
jgi:hypothetical protein